MLKIIEKTASKKYATGEIGTSLFPEVTGKIKQVQTGALLLTITGHTGKDEC